MRGNCYVASEALWHILGGQEGRWLVMRMKVPGDTHWFLQHKVWGTVLDPSRQQFGGDLPAYNKAKHAAFLTKQPSKRARALMQTLTYQEDL